MKTLEQCGGPAFPFKSEHVDGTTLCYSGMSIRDYLAVHAPVSYEMALNVYGSSSPPVTDIERATFFAVWSLLRYEYADSMLEERANP